MYSNGQIAAPLEKAKYGAVNYTFSFDDLMSYSWGSPSNMWCHKCNNNKNDFACQREEAKSFCKPSGYYATQEYNKNFFT